MTSFNWVRRFYDYKLSGDQVTHSEYTGIPNGFILEKKANKSLNFLQTLPKYVNKISTERILEQKVLVLKN